MKFYLNYYWKFIGYPQFYGKELAIRELHYILLGRMVLDAYNAKCENEYTVLDASESI